MKYFFRALRHRNYKLFFSGQLISLIGTSMQSVAPIGGTVADRSKRHRIIVTTQSLSMIMPLVLAALTFTGRVKVWHVFTLARCLGASTRSTFPRGRRFWSKWWAAKI